MAPADAGADLPPMTADQDEDTICPICLEDFPKLTWRGTGRTRFMCCGKALCTSCHNALRASHFQTVAREVRRERLPPESERVREIFEERGECPLCRTRQSVDRSEPFRLAQAHAERGKPWALTAVGKYHRDGTGTPKNFVAAFENFRKAAEAGDTEAQHHLGE